MYENIRQHQKYPDIVTESYMRSMMMAILVAALETTANANANAFVTLLQDRDVWEDLCRNPALIPSAVEECLRVGGSIIAWRRIATAEARVGGVRIPEGGKLLIVMASANKDERHWENPETVDIYRDNAADHLSFGYGAHQCMGKNTPGWRCASSSRSSPAACRISGSFQGNASSICPTPRSGGRARSGPSGTRRRTPSAATRAC